MCGCDAVEGWQGRAWRSRIPEFVELQRKIKRHMDAIVATAEHGITNARVESVNNGIKLIVKMGFGYRNFDNLRAMVMLKHSGLPIELPGRPAKEKKRKGQRGRLLRMRDIHPHILQKPR